MYTHFNIYKFTTGLYMMCENFTSEKRERRYKTENIESNMWNDKGQC